MASTLGDGDEVGSSMMLVRVLLLRLLLLSVVSVRVISDVGVAVDLVVGTDGSRVLVIVMVSWVNSSSITVVDRK